METDGGGAGQQERNMADDIFNCFKERVTTGPECFPVCQDCRCANSEYRTPPALTLTVCLLPTHTHTGTYAHARNTHSHTHTHTHTPTHAHPHTHCPRGRTVEHTVILAHVHVYNISTTTKMAHSY